MVFKSISSTFWLWPQMIWTHCNIDCFIKDTLRNVGQKFESQIFCVWQDYLIEHHLEVWIFCWTKHWWWNRLTLKLFYKIVLLRTYLLRVNIFYCPKMIFSFQISNFIGKNIYRKIAFCIHILQGKLNSSNNKFYTQMIFITVFKK